MRIVGLDLSLTSSGLAEWHDGTWEHSTHGTKGKAGATLAQRSARLDHTAGTIVAYTLGGGMVPDVVLVEAHSFAAQGGQQHDRSGLWWLVVRDLVRAGLQVIEVAPTSLKKFATGKGNASKDQMLLTVSRRHPDLDFTTNDEADAIALVDLALVKFGYESGYDYQHDAIAKIAWP
jgi:crossover junction endodeoxyribonuclease RuvC